MKKLLLLCCTALLLLATTTDATAQVAGKLGQKPNVQSSKMIDLRNRAKPLAKAPKTTVGTTQTKRMPSAIAASRQKTRPAMNTLKTSTTH
jgi:hypothetical protein